MAEMSPMCSIIVAKARGMIVMIAVMARPVSKPGPASEKTVFSHKTGRPIHDAWATGVKSTRPRATAAT